jgi:hypothetical protein
MASRSTFKPFVYAAAFGKGLTPDRPVDDGPLSQGEFPQARFSNLCGERDLAASLAELAACEEFRGVDSSLLHYARWLGLRCLSFWGPTDPRTRLRPIPGLVEEAVYRKVACSPCIHVSEEPPCRGRNVCMQRLFQSEKGWSVGAVGQDDSQDLPILVYP